MTMTISRSALTISLIFALTAIAGCASPPKSFGQADVTCAQFESFSTQDREKTLSRDAAQRSVFEYTTESGTVTDEAEFFAKKCKDSANSAKTLRDLKWANAEPNCKVFFTLSPSIQEEWARGVLEQQNQWKPTNSLSTVAAKLVEECGGPNDASLLWVARGVQEKINKEAADANREPVVDTPSEPSQPKERTITWRNESKYGYVTDSTLTIGNVLLAPLQHPSDSQFTAGVACGFTPQKDAAIPLTLITTNGTPTDFQVVVSRFALTHGSNSNLLTTGYLESQLNGNGTEFCESPSSNSTQVSIGVSSGGTVGPTAWIKSLYFVILKDYFSPRYPDGAKPELEEYSLTGMKRESADDPNVEFTSNRMTLTGKVSG